MKKAFLVEIEESYHKTVVVFADSEENAEEIADKLCNSHDIELGSEQYAGRNVSCSGKACEDDCGYYTVVDENGVV